MNRDKAMKLIIFALVNLALSVQPLAAAEVRGSVSFDYHGLFGNAGTAQSNRISVALLPAEGQHTVPRGKRRQRIEIVNNRMTPAFLTVQKGDSIEFVNRGNVYHELFSLSPGEPVKARLGKAGDHDRDKTEFHFKQAGTTHFFCRIHNKSYARIDVVETPYLQMVEPGGRFHFVGLAPGLWRLRLAAPAAETKWLDVVAMITPPPLSLTLVSHGGGQAGTHGLDAGADIGQLYRHFGDSGHRQ
jgi:plastocyanin